MNSEELKDRVKDDLGQMLEAHVIMVIYILPLLPLIGTSHFLCCKHIPQSSCFSKIISVAEAI